MNNVKVKEIIKFSLYKNIQNKWFVIFNIITLFSILIMFNWNIIASPFTSESENKVFNIAVLDTSNIIYNAFYEQFENNTNFKIERISENTYTSQNIPDNFAIVEIIPDDIEIFKTSIISKEGIPVDNYTPITDALYNIRNSLFSQKYNISASNLEIFQSDLNITRVMLAVNADDSSSKELIKLFSSAFTYILTILIFSKMANEIAQEKQSKSSEYLLTTVSAKEYMFSKIFSNIAILLIQGLLLFVYYFIAISLTNIINIATTDLTLSSGILTNSISLDVCLYVLALLVYNILNLILLCIIQATLSAKTSSTSEAGNTVSLLIFMMMAAYIATIYIITPYTKISNILYIISCLPGLSAYFVPAMMVIGQANIWQIIISLIILIFSIPITFNFCSKIFKNGILDYTKVKNSKFKKEDKKSKTQKFLTKRKMQNIGFVIGTSVLIYIGIQSLLSLLGNFVLPTLLGNIFTDTEITLILQAILQIVSLGLASYFVFAYCKKIPKENFKHSNNLKIVTVTLLIIFGLQLLLSGVIYPKLGLDYEITDMFNVDVNSSILSKIILIISIALIPGIFEELFFRKALIDFMIPYGKYFALLFSALLFGIIHMNLSQGLFAFIIGILLGIIYLHTKNIKLTMLIHFINNGFAALTMILSETEIVIASIILLIFLIIGLVFLILTFINKDSRNRIKKIFEIKLSFESIKNKYKYLFADFTFDVAMILIFVMSVLTENMLR